MSTAIGAALVSEGFRVRHVVPGAQLRQASADRFEADLGNPRQVAELHVKLKGADDSLTGCVINLLGICPPFGHPGGEPENALRLSLWTFNLAREFENDLRDSAVAGGGCFYNVTGLGGQFGLGEDADEAALDGAGTLGIAKTLRREAPQLTVKTIDIDLSLEPHVLSTRLLDEFAADDELIEVGLTRKGRWKLDLVPAPVSSGNLSARIDAQAVVLVTGGAFGVTADTAIGLARETGCRLVLVGRSALPGEEPVTTRGLSAQDVRKRLIEQSRQSGERLTPADIEKRVARVLKDRQIRANYAACQAAASAVEYHSLDVRDAAALGALVDDIYARHGRLDGVVHGAGIIEDKRICDKTPESFANVFRTKVDSALTLAAKLRPEGLKFLVFFSSVSGRFGNTGQVDYSAANEFLNKLADFLSRRWPTRVVAINWGPWDGGMVTDELRRMYATVGFDLIPIDVGVRFFLDETRNHADTSAEVVVSGSVEQMLGVAVGSGA